MIYTCNPAACNCPCHPDAKPCGACMDFGPPPELCQCGKLAGHRSECNPYGLAAAETRAAG